MRPQHAWRDDDAGLVRVWRILFQDRRHCLGARVALEGASPREHLVEDAPEGEDVRAVIAGLAADLFRRHVAHRAQHHTGLGRRRHRRGVCRGRHRRTGLPREAEVQDLHRAVGGDEDVLRLQIAVGDLPVVCGGQAAGHLRGDLQRLALRQRAAVQPRAQRLSLQQLQHGVRGAVAPAHVVDRQDVGVRQRGDRTRFPFEARERVRVGRHGRRDDLDRDVPLQPRVPRAIDLAHATGADGGEDFVWTESGSGGERGQVVRGSYNQARLRLRLRRGRPKLTHLTNPGAHFVYHLRPHVAQGFSPANRVAGRPKGLRYIPTQVHRGFNLTTPIKPGLHCGVTPSSSARRHRGLLQRTPACPRDPAAGGNLGRT